MQTFVVCSATVRLALPITHPVRLSDHFIRYRDAAASNVTR